MSQAEELRLIKNQVKEATEIERGVILSSGRPSHYYLIGTERLLTEEQLVTFLGRCLLMKDEEDDPLVDPRWVGHGLTPTSYFVELDGRGSVYESRTRFTTLRISMSDIRPHLPQVVDVL